MVRSIFCGVFDSEVIYEKREHGVVRGSGKEACCPGHVDSIRRQTHEVRMDF